MGTAAVLPSVFGKPVGRSDRTAQQKTWKSGHQKLRLWSGVPIAGAYCKDVQHEPHSVFQPKPVEDSAKISFNRVSIEAQFHCHLFVLFAMKDQAYDPGLLRRKLQRMNNVLPRFRREERRKQTDRFSNS